jgi:post-segregation antitoxin (ccd killing protein)
MTPYGIEPATFWFVAQYLNHCATISGPLYTSIAQMKLQVLYIQILTVFNRRLYLVGWRIDSYLSGSCSKFWFSSKYIWQHVWRNKEFFSKQNSVMSVNYFDREMYANMKPGSVNISTAKSTSLAKTRARSEASSFIRKPTSAGNWRIVLKNFCVWLEDLKRRWILSPHVTVVGTILKRKYLS